MSLITDDDRTKGAVISEDGRYRYSLWRAWDRSLEPLTFVMLNPSTADANVDDPTIRRCIGFAKRDGFGGVRVVNLYAFRATQPKDMFRAIDPVGPLNNDYFNFGTAATVIAAWGAHARPNRVRDVMRLLRERTVYCLGTTKDGSPRHPLYVRADQPLIPFGAAS